MAEQNINSQQVKHENSLTFDKRVLEKIANYSVSNVDGILELKGDLTSNVKNFFSSSDKSEGVSAEVGHKEVALDIEVIAEYGKSLPKAFDKAVDQITKNVESMTGLKVVEVNMTVSDIQTRGDYEQSKSDDERQQAEERRRAAQNGEYTDGSRVQ